MQYMLLYELRKALAADVTSLGTMDNGWMNGWTKSLQLLTTKCINGTMEQSHGPLENLY